MEFFQKLGCSFEPRFSDEIVACMVVDGDIFVRLLTEAKFQEFTPKLICDAGHCSEVLLCLSCGSRREVDILVSRAVAAGGNLWRPKENGFMYGHGLQDPDGHIGEFFFMEPGGEND